LDKSPDAFRTISEAADELDLPQHVLRFWETRFPTIKPLKRGGGRRYYRPEDVLLLKGIRHLLYDQGFTIRGVQRILKDRGQRYVAAIGEGRPPDQLPPPMPDADDMADDVAADESSPMDEPAATDREQGRSIAALTGADREALSGVLRELLDCKRLLDRAREG
jgi:DNA-binding transcriptional MerR regulator